MSDVLEGGRPRRPLPRWTWALVGLAVTGAIVVVLTRGGSHRSAAPSPASSPARSSSPSSSPSPSPAAAPTPATGSGVTSAGATPAPWPNVPGACGSTAYLPLITSAQRYDPVDATVIVGGVGLQSVNANDPQAAAASAVPGLPHEQGQIVGDIVAGPHGTYVSATPCDSNSGSGGPVYKIVDGVARPIGLTADFLLGGAHHAWRVTYPPPDPSAFGPMVRPGAVVAPLDGGRSITLQPDAYPVAETAAGLIVARSDPTAPDSPPALEVLDASTGAVVRALAAGYPLAADAHALLAQTRSCGFDEPVACTLERIDTTTAATTGSYSLPVGRAITSLTMLSPDGRLAAFQLTRTAPDPRFDTGHPAPPSDVVILHLDTGQLDVVPNLEMAPKTEAGLAFDGTGGSLFITTTEGDHGQLLIWQHGMSGPALVTTVPGPIAGAPPLLVLGGASAPS